MDTQHTTKTQELESIISRQESLLKDLRREISEIDSQKIIEENELLKDSVKVLNEKANLLEKENKELSKNLEATKAALFTKMANEKLSAFKRVQKEIDASYYREENSIQNRLQEYRKTCLKNISIMRERIDKAGTDNFIDLKTKLSEIERDFNVRYSEIQKQMSSDKEKLTSANDAWRSKVENEPLTELEKKTAVKQKNFETFVGLNVLSKAGIVLFLIGIIALGRFAYTRLPDLFKALLIYALGAVLIGVGEYFHKKEKTVFSTALISGGVAVLYAAVATGYFALSIYSVETTFILCVAVTAIAIFLSAQLKNQVVCAFATVGGYLPLIVTYMIGFGSAAADKTFLPVSSVYFCLLSVVVFVMTYNKKWYAAQFIGYGFQLLAVLGVSRCCWILRNVTGYDYAMPLAIGFSLVSFIIYMAVSASKIISNSEIKITDTVLLGLNTLSGAVSVGINIYNSVESKQAVGFTFLAFAAIYAFLASRLNKGGKKSETTSATQTILMLGALVFSMLVVPMIFGWQYIGIAWAVEGAVIAAISINMNRPLTEIAGLITMFLSLGYIFTSHNDLVTMVTLTVMILTFWIYVVLGMKLGTVRPLYTVIEIILSLLTPAYVAYMVSYIFSRPWAVYSSEFDIVCAAAISAVLISAFLDTSLLRSKVVEIYNIIYRFVFFMLIVVLINWAYPYNDVVNYLGTDYHQSGIITIWTAVNIVLLIAVNIFAIFVISSGINRFLNHFNMPVWIYTAVLSVTSLISITTVLTNQFGVKFSNVIISAIYIAVACALIFVGFKKRYTVVRTGGLVLILCALAKLCFIDTRALDTPWKIGSYFAFGAVLIVISYFYQKFSKKLERETVDAVTENQENSSGN